MENENQSNLVATMAAPTNGSLVSDGMATLVDCLRSVRDNLSSDKAALAGARATAQNIDREVAAGRPLDEVLADLGEGQRFWVQSARPFSNALATASA